MKIVIFCVLILIYPSIVQAQYNVTFIINEGVNQEKDTVYITGSFNNWNYSANDKYKLKINEFSQRSISLNLEAEKYEFKFHRGSNGQREMKFYGDHAVGELPDRIVDIASDTIVSFTIDTWLDKMPYKSVYFLSKSTIRNFHSLQNLNIWKYKAGNDNAWSEIDLNTSDWENLKPKDINKSFADKNGRIEGWFRTRFILDSTFKDKPVNMWVDSWAATETYIDGKLVQSSGNTGRDGEPFKEGRYIHVIPDDLILTSGVEHILAIHFVDKLSALPKNAYKGPLKIEFAEDSFWTELEEHISQEPIFVTITLTIGITMTFLFWFLVVLIPGESNLKRIAIFSSLLTLLVITYWMKHNPYASYNSIVITNFIINFLPPTILIYSILLLVKIFNRKITRTLIIIFIIIGLLGVSTILNLFQDAPLIGLGIVIVTSIYYIISSFKSLKGAQWAVVAGISSLFFVVILMLIYAIYSYNTGNYPGFLTQSMFIMALNLSFPLSLVVYTALRFKEIIKEVQLNAEKVVKLSEEKKEQVIQQKRLLEEEVARQTIELRNSLNNLKSTQSQLIQSEKMASLGELTAGIAHEIQNPLNFVNNFSEVNNELAQELNEEIEKGNLEEVKDIAKNIIENEEKIRHHGKRAESIVKGMLQHSRTSSGQRELTDINELADEYLRLAYHGLRAKDKSFNADFKTDLDPELPNIEVMPQDIGRVLLNIINNAFYAVSSKASTTEDKDYQPLVTVSTKTLDNKLEIIVKDNGPGIPGKFQDKIFQPFFTTKPTGSGTGLGLSLSYDIIKAHGGDINLETQPIGEEENAGTKFIMSIPFN